MIDSVWISISLLWFIVIVQGVIILALVRQVGVLYERIAPAGALSVANALQAGDQAPSLSVIEEVSGAPISIGMSSDRAQLLFFAAPNCPVCKSVMPALLSSAKSEQSWLDTIIATDIPSPDVKGYIRDHKLASVQVVNSELLGRSFNVAKLPYAVLIDRQGKIKSSGLINSREHIESLFVAKELNQPNLQAYLQQREPAHA